jgi:glycosyltransferase involved in cell wall biosynthesis
MTGVLGKPDSPTDAIEDYCRLIGSAFRQRLIDLVIVRVRWDSDGWVRALQALWRKGQAWKGQWALVQYTALMWSRRGIPLVFLFVVCILRMRSVRVAVVFHDPQPYGGRRLIDRARRGFQLLVMRCAYRMSHVTVLTVPLEKASWLPGRRKAAFIPVGANIPAFSGPVRSARNGDEPKTIAVFAVTDTGDIRREVLDIVRAATRVAECGVQVRLVTLGRGSAESEGRFRTALEGSGVEFTALGVLSADRVSEVLSNADVALFVRGPVTTQRGSAIASVSSCLPLVAYAEPNPATPLAEAGIIGVPYPDGEALAEATARVLTDARLWRALHERSRRAEEKYFSWDAIACRFLEVLKLA